MKRAAFSAALAGILILGALTLPARGAPQLGHDSKQKASRLLLGKVMDNHDNPLPDAVVYLINTRDRSVKTYIVGPEGTYRFPALSNAVDYEVYAQYKGHKSETKSVSQFDDRSQVYLDLKIDIR